MFLLILFQMTQETNNLCNTNGENEVKNEKNTQCKYCDQEFKYLFMKTIHIKRIHEKVKVGDLKCDFCSKIYKDQYHLISHIQTIHERVFKFKCQSCPKAYGTARMLRDHTERNHENNIYNCSICDKPFTSKKCLIAHSKQIHIFEESVKNYQTLVASFFLIL